MNYTVDKILEAHPHITPNIQEKHLRGMLNKLVELDRTEGAVVELGCHAGLTSLYIRRVLDATQSKKEFHVYDSFEGLPDELPQDNLLDDETYFTKGLFKIDEGEQRILNKFKDAKLEPPIIHTGWFASAEYPDKISFAFLDGDFYSSILDGLEAVYPRMVEGGVIFIHDYGWDRLKGVKEAVTDYFGTLENVVDLQGLAMITK